MTLARLALAVALVVLAPATAMAITCTYPLTPYLSEVFCTVDAQCAPTACAASTKCETTCAYCVYETTHQCRGSAGVCDQAELCTHTGPTPWLCPTDTFKSGNVCNASSSACDPAETCNGSGAACPADVNNCASPPTATIAVSATHGPIPFVVTFDGTDSVDAVGGSVTYAWDLDDDGAFDDSTAGVVERTFTGVGAYVVRLRVTAANTQVAIATVQVTADPIAPTVQITAPVAAQQWEANGSLQLAAVGIGGDGTAIASNDFDWTFGLERCVTSHGVDSCSSASLGAQTGASVTLTTPDVSDAAGIRYAVTATDAFSQRVTVSGRVEPALTPLTVASTPSGLFATVGDDLVVTPATVSLVRGAHVAIGSDAVQSLNGETYAFVSWSDGGALAHTVTVSATTIAATFEVHEPAADDPTFMGDDVIEDGGCAGVTPSLLAVLGVLAVVMRRRREALVVLAAWCVGCGDAPPTLGVSDGLVAHVEAFTGDCAENGALLPSSHLCRASAGPCDVAEYCTGTNPACPYNAFAAAGTQCAAAAGICDNAAVCSGISSTCPQRFAVTCSTPIDECGGCDDGNPCTLDSCASGPCEHVLAADGTVCDDGLFCTSGDVCTHGVCAGALRGCGTRTAVCAAPPDPDQPPVCCSTGHCVEGDHSCRALPDVSACETFGGRPNVILLVDNSVSMATSTGAGTNSCGAPKSRLSDAKCALSSMIATRGEISFALERFREDGSSGSGNPGTSTTCGPDCNPGAVCPSSCVNCDVTSISCAGCEPSTGSGCPAQGATSARGELLVEARLKNEARLLPWLDYKAVGCGTTTVTTPGQEPELAATTYAPIAGALRTARSYLVGAEKVFASASNAPSPIDDRASCSKQYVVLITDSTESCAVASESAAAATELRSVSFLGRTHDVRTFVVGVGNTLSVAQRTELDAIAMAGGTDAARFTTSEDELRAALDQVLTAMQLVETCNGLDDDCNGLIDEGCEL